MKVNQDALKHAKSLIKSGKVIDGADWSKNQPSADDENKFQDKHGWSDYGKWYLGIDHDDDPKKGDYHFPFGDFKKVHREGVIAAKQRAAQNGHRDIEKAADELLQMIDERATEKA